MLILKSLLIIFCFLHLVSYPPYLDQADASTSTLTLEITWNGRATDKVTIKETFTGTENFLNTSGEVDLSFFRMEVGPDVRNNIVGEITVNNENGAPLSFRKTETEEGYIHWLISPGNSEKVIVSYEIAFKYYGGGGYLGAVLDNLLCGSLEATFIVPSLSTFSEFPFKKGDIRIKLNTPSSLNVYTPWDFDGVYYHIWHQAGDDLEAWRVYYSYWSFMGDSFAVGEFWENSELVNGMNFVVIISKLIPNLEQSDIDKIYAISKDSFKFMNNVWGKSIGTKYLIIYLPYCPDGNIIALGEASASQGSTLFYDHENIYNGGGLVHQFGHRWDGFQPFGLNMDWGDFSYYNFREGGTVYYEIKTAKNIGYDRPIEWDIGAYETIRGTPRDKPIALVHHGSSPDDEIIYYSKNSLVYYLLDKEIQIKTNHTKSLDDVSTAIFLEHGVYPGHMNTVPLTMTKYIEMVNNVTGYDFHSFFDDYYYSVGDIDISSDLTSDPDGNGLTIYEEVLLNYKPGAPKPNFEGSPTSGPAPLTVNFADLSAGSITSWLWDFGDSTTSSIKNPSHTYNSEGVYTVSLTVTGSGGSDTEKKVSYIVVRQETISAPSTPNGPSNGTTGRSFNYTAGDSSSNLLHSLEYRFDWGDGTYSGWSSSSSASKSWSLFGSYTVKAQARCATDTAVVSDWSSGLTVNIMVPITLQSPFNNASLGVCSLYSPPSFSWTPAETFRSYQIQFSPDGSFSSMPVRVKVSGTLTQMVIALNTWKKVLSLSGMSGGPVYWKVVGTRTDRETATSEPYSIITEATQPVEGETISPNSRTSLPTLIWENNCNTKFKVWFGNDPDFTKPDMKKKTLSFNTKNPNDNNGLFTKPLTPGQWGAIRKVVENVSGSTIYWKVESWDGLNRHAETDVMSFVLAD